MKDTEVCAQSTLSLYLKMETMNQGKQNFLESQSNLTMNICCIYRCLRHFRFGFECFNIILFNLFGTNVERFQWSGHYLLLEVEGLSSPGCRGTISFTMGLLHCRLLSLFLPRLTRFSITFSPRSLQGWGNERVDGSGSQARSTHRRAQVNNLVTD